jgi:hypothetical protein
MELFPDGLFGKMSQELSQATTEKTLEVSSEKWLTSGRITQNGLSWTHRTTESPNGGGASFSSLVSILEPLNQVPTRYYLSGKAARGILRRSERRGKTLPEVLRLALEAVATEESQVVEENISSQLLTDED